MPKSESSGILRWPAIRAVLIVAVTLIMFMQSSGTARASNYCSPGETPVFRFGFAYLKSLLGSTMGEPLECEHANPDNGDTLQQTTTGLSFYLFIVDANGENIRQIVECPEPGAMADW